MDNVMNLYLRQLLERARTLNEEQQRINENLFSVFNDLQEKVGSESATDGETPESVDAVLGVGSEKELDELEKI